MSRVWIMALRVSGMGVTGNCMGRGAGCPLVGKESEDAASSSDTVAGGGCGFAAWIALAKAMVRLPWPVPASRISRGGGRGDLSSG